MNSPIDTLLPLDCSLDALIAGNGRWTAKAQKELTSIAARIGPDALARMPLPWKALGSPSILTSLIEAGMRSGHTQPPKDFKAYKYMREQTSKPLFVSAREAAARLDAAPEVHRLLDTIGVPPVSGETATKWGIWITKDALMNSLAHLFDVQPEVMRGVTVETNALLPLFLGDAWESRRERSPKKAEALLVFGLAHDANWSAYVNGLKRDKKALLPVFEAAIAAASARHLSNVLAEAPARPRARM